MLTSTFNLPLEHPMSTATCCLPASVPLHCPWWRRALDLVRATIAHPAGAAGRARPLPADERSLTALDGLTPETLRDIGVPDWMVERARAGRPSAIDPAHWR